ncbi:MAG TPA: hypothetical protein VM118_04460 [Acidobacteriota bacterium]|nr:hypothetical protein [Acidobacteriota bacterium]
MRHGTANHRLYRTWVTLGVIAILGASADSLPAASPGLQIGITSYDMQHNAAIGHQVAKNPGANTVHFCWTMWDQIPATPEDYSHFVNYNSYDITTSQLNQGMNGVSVSYGDWARAGFCRIDTDSDNLAHLAMHQRVSVDDPYSAWHLLFPVEGSGLHFDNELAPPSGYPYASGALWADIAIEQNHGLKDAGTDIYHIIAIGICDGCYPATPARLWYWRYDAGASTPIWEGPVLIDSTRNLSYTMDADDNSDRVCLVFTSNWCSDGLSCMNNVAYRETQTSGSGWLTGVELGEINKKFASYYGDPIGPSAWIETSVLYDQAGDLHILFAEQRESGSEQIALRHWRKSRNPGGWPVSEPVVYAWYETPGTWGRVLNIGFISIGVGDGSTLCDGGGEDNSDYLYVVYGKLCGETPAEQADTSALGFCNAELYLSVSRDHGDFWSNPINLTNTKTPDCNPVDPEIPGPGDCASEAWASLARTVDDLHILYIADRQAGALDESGWTINPVNYLRIPGGTTNDPYLCATPPPVYAGSLDSNAGPCGYYELMVGEQDSTTLRLYNTGPGPMTGTISVQYLGSVDWLLVDGAKVVDYDVPPADSLTAVVTLNPALLSPLWRYEGQVLVSHNDHLQTSPDTFSIVLAIDWCICRGDPQCDGVTNVLDVVQTVNVAFRGAPPVFDLDCPLERTDADCTGSTDVLDVVHIVNVAFRGGDPLEEFQCVCH